MSKTNYDNMKNININNNFNDDSNDDINESKSILNNNITFLVEKYIPNNINDIFDPVYEYNKLNNNLNTNNDKNTNNNKNNKNTKDTKTIKNIENIRNTYNNENIKNDWINYSPRKCYFHRDILRKLQGISNDECLPHIIFYGNPGTGKKSMINLFLEMIFDESIYNTNNTKYTVISSGNIENEVIVKQSDYHIIIEPNNNNFDRYLIQDIVKEYAKRYPLCIFEKSRSFKVVQINNLDNLSYYAQTSLRRTIEKYSKTCRFIMWCYSLSKVIEPLRSRCLCIHIPTIPDDTLFEWLYNISRLEKININLNILDKIITSSHGNLKDILWKLDLYKTCGKIDNNYQMALNNLNNELKKNQNIDTIRTFVHNMLITNISSNTILKNILNILLHKIQNYPVEKINFIIKTAGELEYRLSSGRRDIIQIEAFLINIINTIFQ